MCCTFVCGCAFAYGHKHEGICLGVCVWVSCNAGVVGMLPVHFTLGVLCWYFFVSFHFVIIVILSLLCWAFYYYVSILLVSCYLFYPPWVNGGRDILWFSPSLV